MQDLTIKYNYHINQAAQIAPLNTIIGTYRLVANTADFVYRIGMTAYHVIQRDRENAYLEIGRLTMAAKQMARGACEMIPCIGALASHLWDNHLLTPAQQLAYKIYYIYHTRLVDWNQILQNDPTLTQMSPEDIAKTHEEFQSFVNRTGHNRAPLFISTNQEKIQEFIALFTNPCATAQDFQHPIFKEPHLPFYALAAFKEEKIDALDMATILNIHTAHRCHDDCKVAPIVDEQGMLTTDAKALDDGTSGVDAFFYAYNLIKGEHHSKWLASLKELPARKRLFFSYRAPLPMTAAQIKSMTPRHVMELTSSPVGSLYTKLILGYFLPIHQGKEIHLAFDAHQLLYNHNFNKTECPFQPKLGRFTPRDIKKGVMQKNTQRLCAMFFPGTESDTHVHKSLELPTIITAHDKCGHAKFVQMYPKEGIAFFKHLIQRFEVITGYDLSKEIWLMTDMVIANFTTYIPSARNFFSDLLLSNGDDYQDRAWPRLFFADGNSNRLHLSLLGWITLLECMEGDRAGWKDIEVPSNLASLYHTIMDSCIKKNIIKEEMPIEEKLWILMQCANGIVIQESILVLSNGVVYKSNDIDITLNNSVLDNLDMCSKDQLTFVKLNASHGWATNTIRLVKKTDPLAIKPTQTKITQKTRAT